MRTGKDIEDRPGVQVAVSAFMILLIVSIFGWNLPAGQTHDKALQVFGPVVRTMGLEQGWMLFSPDPRDFSRSIHATITYEDGHTKVWNPPHNGLVLSPYRTYRWQKAVERIYAGRETWKPTTDWLAREQGPGVTKIVLTRTWRFVTVPGSDGPRGQAGSYDLFTARFA